MTKPQLVIIPGLGDRGKLYHCFVPFWSTLGFEVHIFVFGWEDQHLSLTDAQTRLMQFIDSLGTPVSVIGVSAGGTAAVNLLAARPNQITSVITICTPYALVPKRFNRLLHASSALMLAQLTGMNLQTKARILSVHAVLDQLVPVRASQPAGIAHRRVRSVWHGPTIFVALVGYRQMLKKFLLQQ